MKQSVKEAVVSVIEDELGYQIEEADYNKDFREHTNIDSMQFISIAARLEEKFDIDLPIEIMGVNTLSEFIKFIEKEIKA